jgi:hypothetical protein
MAQRSITSAKLNFHSISLLVSRATAAYIVVEGFECEVPMRLARNFAFLAGHVLWGSSLCRAEGYPSDSGRIFQRIVFAYTQRLL